MNPDSLLYTDEAAAKAHVKPGTIRSWASRYPDILPKHPDRRGRPRYKLRDVLKTEQRTRRADRSLTALS